MRSRLLIVGEDFGNAPERYAREIYTLTGKSGKRLASLMGFEGDQAMFEYALSTERVNVVARQPDWKDQALVASRVAELEQRFVGRRVVLLGVRVAAAFGVSDLDLLTWRHDSPRRAWLARVPHPSGRSHWWNEEANVLAAAGFLRDALELAGVRR